MSEECLICKAPLQYLTEDEIIWVMVPMGQKLHQVLGL